MFLDTENNGRMVASYNTQNNSSAGIVKYSLYFGSFPNEQLKS